MSLLETAASAYELAQTVQPERYLVRSPAMRRYSKAVQGLVRSLGDEAGLPLWETLISSAKAARWRAGAEAIPLSAAEGGARLALGEVVAQSTRLEQVVDYSLVAQLRNLRRAATDLFEEDNASMAQALLTCLADGDPDDTCVISCRGRTALVTREWLGEQGLPRPVLTPRDFRGKRWDFAVVVGPSDWYPSHIFTCPNASAMTLVHYSHLQDSQRVRGLFGSAATTPIAVTIRSEPITRESDDNDEDQFEEAVVEQPPQPEWSVLVNQATPRLAHPGEFKGWPGSWPWPVVLVFGFRSTPQASEA